MVITLVVTFLFENLIIYFQICHSHIRFISLLGDASTTRITSATVYTAKNVLKLFSLHYYYTVYLFLLSVRARVCNCWYRTGRELFISCHIVNNKVADFPSSSLLPCL